MVRLKIDTEYNQNISIAERKKRLESDLNQAKKKVTACVLIQNGGTEGVLAAHATMQNQPLVGPGVEEECKKAAERLKTRTSGYHLIMRLWFFYQTLKFLLRYQQHCVQRSSHQKERPEPRSRFIP